MGDLHFRPDKRSIYFKSLLNSNNPFSYLSNRLDGFKIDLHNSSLMSNGMFTSDAIKKYKQALSILEDGISSEYTNEQAYFTNLLTETKFNGKKFDKFRNELQTIISKSPVDYIALTNLINKILLGENEYKAILKLEKKRLEQLDEALDKLNERLQKEGSFSVKHSALKKGDKIIVDEWTEIISTPEELRNFLQNEYLQKHKLETFSDDFKDVCETVDNLASKVINETIYTILNSETVRTYLTNVYNNGKDIFIDDFSTYLINNILYTLWENGYLEKIILNTLGQNTINQKKLIDSIINDIEKNFSKRLIQGQTSTFGQTKTKNTLKYNKNELQQYIINGEGLADSILEMLATKKVSKDNDYFNLSDSDSETYKYLQDLKKALKKLENEEKKKNPNEQTINTRKKEVADAKRKLSNAAKSAAQSKLNQIENDELKEEFLVNARNSLKAIKFYISGPTHEEIIDGIRQKFDNEIFIHTGPENLKVDSIRIRYNNIQLKTKIPQKYITKTYETVKGILEESVQTFYSTFSKNLPNAGEATNLAQGKEAFYQAMKESSKKIKELKNKEINESEEGAAALKKVALSMKDTIIVTETDKTFNTYFKDIGFVSGSLGPNVATQIGNFKELFNSAGVGMSDEEAEWLEIAIVNCSPNALGSENKGPIEQYLSTLAGFAVFDEGSAELELITHNVKEKALLKSSPKLLHLYKLDGIYYPGSFILQRIHEQLTSVFNDTGEQIEQQTHDGAHIRATANENIIPKRKLLSEQDMSSWWKDTYEIASTHYTSIDVSFLSNLFNIVNQLGERMKIK